MTVTTNNPPDRAELCDFAAELSGRGESLEEILGALRARGATVSESLYVIRSVTRMSLSEAKDFVHGSAAWADIGPDLARSHESLHQAVEHTGRPTTIDREEYLQVNLPDE